MTLFMNCENTVDMPVVLITGAGQGIGKACAKVFAENKFKVVIADLNLSNANAVCGNLRELGLEAMSLYVDISDSKSIDDMINCIVSKYNKVDVLINNASVQSVYNVLELPESEWRRVIDVNLTGTFLCSCRVVKCMKNSGKIINMLSVHHDRPRKNKVHYDCAKAGVAMLTKEMALELAENNITVNAISFGAVDTPMNSDWINDKVKLKDTLNKIPLKKIFSSNDIAQFTYNIVTNFSGDTTGSIFTIDAGRSLT